MEISFTGNVLYCVVTVPRADHSLAQNLKGCGSLATARLKRSNLQERDKILGSRSLPRQTDIRLRLQNFLREPMKVVETYPVSYSFHALTRQNVGRNATSSSPYIKTFSNCYSVDTSVSFKEKQQHLQFHLTWTRGTQFGEGPCIGSALVRVRQPICSEFSAMEANLFHRSELTTIVQFVS